MMWLFDRALTDTISRPLGSDESGTLSAAALYKLQLPKCHNFPESKKIEQGRAELIITNIHGIMKY